MTYRKDTIEENHVKPVEKPAPRIKREALIRFSVDVLGSINASILNDFDYCQHPFNLLFCRKLALELFRMNRLYRK